MAVGFCKLLKTCRSGNHAYVCQILSILPYLHQYCLDHDNYKTDNLNFLSFLNAISLLVPFSSTLILIC